MEDAKSLLLLLDMDIMVNPIDFFRGDVAVRSCLNVTTIGFDAYLDEIITIPNPWSRKKVNIKKTRCGQLTDNISAKTWSFFMVIEILLFSDIWLLDMKGMKAIGTIPMERGHGMWSWFLTRKRGDFLRKRAKFTPVVS